MSIVVGISSPNVCQALERALGTLLGEVERGGSFPPVTFLRYVDLGYWPTAILITTHGLTPTEALLELRIMASGFDDLTVTTFPLPETLASSCRPSDAPWRSSLRGLLACSLTPFTAEREIDLQMSRMLSTFLHDRVLNPLSSLAIEVDRQKDLPVPNAHSLLLISNALSRLESLRRHPKGSAVADFGDLLRQKFTATLNAIGRADRRGAASELRSALQLTSDFRRRCAVRRNRLKDMVYI